MSSDPYHALPGGAGEAARIEDIRSGDPSRFFPSARNGVVDAVTGRILDVPRVSTYRVAAQVVSSAVLFPAGWDTVDYDNDNMIKVNNRTVITCTTAGVYKVTGWFTWDVSSAGQRGLLIYKTDTKGNQTLYPGAGVLSEGASVNATAGGLYTTQGPLSYDVVLTPGDTVTMRVSQFTGGNLSIIPATSAQRYNGFQASWISSIGSDNG